MTRTVSIIGDRFMLSSMFEEAIRHRAKLHELTIRTHDMPWPDEPMAEFLDGLEQDQLIQPPPMLFAKLTDEQIAAWVARFGGAET